MRAGNEVKAWVGDGGIRKGGGLREGHSTEDGFWEDCEICRDQ
jgi:hypothetical protein